MTRYYLSLKDFHSIPSAYQMDVSRFSGLTGNNIGNLVFRKGLDSMVKDLGSYQRLSFQCLSENPDICNQADVVLLSCANWLGTSPMHEKGNKKRAEYLRRFSCPVISFGLGIQAPDHQESIQLGPNTIELAEILSEKSQFISCRCHTTAMTLKNHGIHNVFVTGCPSNFINLRLSKNNFRRIPLQQEESRMISCLISEVAYGNPDSVAMIRHVFDNLEHSPSKYVLQVAQLLHVLYHESEDVPVAYRSALPSLPPERMLSLIREKAMAFCSVDDWLFAAKRFDFSYGMRIHGSMTSLQAGVPTVIVTHDQRTKGLADTMSLPQMDIKRFLGSHESPVLSAYQNFWDNIDAYFETRRKLAASFLEFLHKNNVAPSDEFNRFCEANA